MGRFCNLAMKVSDAMQWMKIGLGALCACMVVASAQASTLVDHRALYKVVLARTTPGSLVQGLNGEMVLDVRELCDGSAVTQTLRTEFWGIDGVVETGRLVVSSFESEDGLRFEFTLHNEIDGTVVESFSGVAERDELENAGMISYEDATFADTKLPQGTVFPTQYMFGLLDAAAAGDRLMETIVFDGADDGKIFKSTAIVGPARETDRLKTEALKAGKTYWPVVLSYFPIESTALVPDYETSFHLYENGVTTQLMMDYGDFAMRGELISLEFLESTVCEE